MTLYKGKISMKVMALLLAVILCVSPYTVSRAYAATSADTSTQGVLSKGIFGILKKTNNMYYVVDEHGNIINGVVSPNGSSLDRYVGRQILIQGNVFAGLLSSQNRRNDAFLGRLREYLSGVVSKSKVAAPKPNPDTSVDDPTIAVVHPMYGAEPVNPNVDPVRPNSDTVVDPAIAVVHPMYGAEPVSPNVDPVRPNSDAIVDPIIAVVHPMYGAEPVNPDLITKQISEQGDKMEVIQKQSADRAELANRNIKAISEPAQKKSILSQIKR